MANHLRDSNSVPTLAGLLSTDGSTITNVAIDPATHVLDTDDNTIGTDAGSDVGRDGNYIPVSFALSEADGVTPVPLYVNASGELLIDSN